MSSPDPLTYIDQIAPQRNNWIKKNIYYHQNIINFYKFNIPDGSTILEVGCGNGYLLTSLKPKSGFGIDMSEAMIKEAKKLYGKLSQYHFIKMNAENIKLKQKFDFIIFSDCLGYFSDVQKVFQEIKKVSTPDTRIIINYHNFLWSPILILAEQLKLKMPSKRLNWLNYKDITSLLDLTDFEVVKKGSRFIFPVKIPLISDFINRYIAALPLFNKICISNFIIAKPLIYNNNSKQFYTVSVVTPARNEKGNIEKAVKLIPKMGKHTEIIFVEGHSNDGTLKEIKRVCNKYINKRDVKYFIQNGKGKGDAVRKGFGEAKGDILMIFDADLTVPPIDLIKFYDAISSGKGEFINGSRLVYPMEDEAMRTLNIFGNKFFSIMFTWILGQKLKDTLCGTKVLFRKHYIKIIQNRKYFGDFDPFGDFDLIFGAIKLNLKIIEIPIRYKARKYGTTNISRFKHGWLLLKMVLFSLNKIKFI